MKFDEVPQDEAFLQEGKIRDVCYVVDKDGHYTRALSKGWKPKNEAIKLAWNQIYEHAEETRLRVLARKSKPDCFLYGSSISWILPYLPIYMNLSRWRVKRHLKMRVFQ